MYEINFDPTIFSVGPFQVRWYGLMYVIGFLVAGFLFKKMIEQDIFKIKKDKIDSLITHVLIGMFFGARLAYVFIYNWEYFSENPMKMFSVWEGGLSFHGAVIGLAFGAAIFARRNSVHFLHVWDAMAIAGSQGLFLGRMGNFINGELYGRITDVPWAMIFPNGGPIPRHPSQIYEGILEGLVIFICLWILRKNISKRPGFITSLFFIMYGCFRYFIEFFREPDAQLGYYFGGTTTMGQILCLIMVIVGVVGNLYCSKKKFPILKN